MPLRRRYRKLQPIAQVAEDLINRAIALMRVCLELAVLAADTLVWMSMCFAMAGPMILSAAYEYRLDWNNLRLLAERGKGIPNVSRARLLLCTVAGAMYLNDTAGQDEELENLLDPGAHSTWSRVMSIAEEVRQLEDDHRQVNSQPAQPQVVSPAVSPHPVSTTRIPGVGPRLKLQTLLNAQPG